MAERTPLGWVCVGPVGAAASPPPTRRPRVGPSASATVSGQQTLKRVCEEDGLATKKPKIDSEKEKHEKERQVPDLHHLGQQEPQPLTPYHRLVGRLGGPLVPELPDEEVWGRIVIYLRTQESCVRQNFAYAKTVFSAPACLRTTTSKLAYARNHFLAYVSKSSVFLPALRTQSLT